MAPRHFKRGLAPRRASAPRPTLALSRGPRLGNPEIPVSEPRRPPSPAERQAVPRRALTRPRQPNPRHPTPPRAPIYRPPPRWPEGPFFGDTKIRAAQSAAQSVDIGDLSWYTEGRPNRGPTLDAGTEPAPPRGKIIDQGQIIVQGQIIDRGKITGRGQITGQGQGLLAKRKSSAAEPLRFCRVTPR